MSAAADTGDVMANDCPCGAHVADPDGHVTYWTDAIIEGFLDLVATKFKFGALLQPFIGSVVNVEAMCSQPRPLMPVFELLDFVFIANGTRKVGDALACAGYDYFCECDDCPPAVTCGTGDAYVIEPLNGYTYEGGTYYNRRYHIPTGAEIWVERPDGYCIGVKNGVWIYFNSPDEGLHWSVNVRDGSDGAPGDSWSDDDYGHTVTLYFAGEQVPPFLPWPEAPAGVADFIGPPSCTTDDVCEALSYVYSSVRRIEFLTQVIAGPMYGVTTDYTVNLPGVGAVTGPLTTFLPRALEGLAPIQPAQLVAPEVLPIDSSSFVELDGQAYAEILLTAVPEYMTTRGTDDTRTFFEKRKDSNPGWVVVMGQSGVLSYHGLNYLAGLELELPATATSIAVHLEAGVEIEMTLYNRQV